jgi:hypothetical protein
MDTGPKQQLIHPRALSKSKKEGFNAPSPLELGILSISHLVDTDICYKESKKIRGAKPRKSPRVRPQVWLDYMMRHHTLEMPWSKTHKVGDFAALVRLYRVLDWMVKELLGLRG